jgi:hypothetical protein
MKSRFWGKTIDFSWCSGAVQFLKFCTKPSSIPSSHTQNSFDFHTLIFVKQNIFFDFHFYSLETPSQRILNGTDEESMWEAHYYSRIDAFEDN